MTKVRIKDIALKAGVSVGTVDRVIHGRGRVGKDAEKKVKAAIEQLNYQPNLAARSLARNKTHKIAIVLPNYEADEFWESQKKGVLRALKGIKHYGIVGDFLTFNDQIHGDLLNLIPTILEGDYEALIIAPTLSEDAEIIFKECEKQEIHYVQINSFLERTNKFSLGYVGQDSYQSGKLAGKLLNMTTPSTSSLALVHMETDVENSNHMISKESGFYDYFQSSEFSRVKTFNFPDFDNKEKLLNFVDQLTRGSDAVRGIFVTTSRVHHLVDALIELNRQNISLVGFDIIQNNIEALSRYSSLFLINQNPSLQGFYGTMRLFDFIMRHKRDDSEKYLPLDIITLENVNNYKHIQDRDNIAFNIL